MFAARSRVALFASAIGLSVLGLAACSGSAGESADATAASSTLAEGAAPETIEPEATSTEAPEGEPDTEEPDTEELDAEQPAAADSLTADRPYDVFVPSGYDAATPMPLVLLLHGYTSSGEGQEAYFQFEPLAESRGFLYVHPDGTIDPRGDRFWNGTDACCAFDGNPPDDAAYLMAIIDEVSAKYSVDPKAIFVAGHSNGGFMSYRMACEHADTIAGVASLAGATFTDAEDCSPSEPVTVLQAHGTNDAVIAYDGGAILGNSYPSARETAETWVAHNGCDTTSTVDVDVLDLDDTIDGAESDVEAFGECEQGATVELWTIDDGVHVPALTDEFSAAVVDFLLAHPKP